MHRHDKKQASKSTRVYITLERLYLNNNVVYSYVNIVIFGVLSKQLKQVVYACTYLGFGCLPWTLTSLHVKDSKTDKTNSQFLQLSMRGSAPSQPHGKIFATEILCILCSFRFNDRGFFCQQILWARLICIAIRKIFIPTCCQIEKVSP